MVECRGSARVGVLGAAFRVLLGAITIAEEPVRGPLTHALHVLQPFAELVVI